MFDPFGRERTSTVSGIQGTGLGMAITRNIVNMMGGTVSADSEVGKGTTFTVSLQFRTCSDPVRQETIPELQGLQALVVDNDFNTCSSVTKMLADIGMRPDWTTSGKEAVLRVKQEKQALRLSAPNRSFYRSLERFLSRRLQPEIRKKRCRRHFPSGERRFFWWRIMN